MVKTTQPHERVRVNPEDFKHGKVVVYHPNYTTVIGGKSPALCRALHCKACDRPLGDKSDPELCSPCMAEVYSCLGGIDGKEKETIEEIIKLN